MALNLPEKLSQRIQALAAQRGTTPEQFVEQLVDQHEEQQNEPAPGTFAALAKSAVEANIGADGPPIDTAERSREILRTEFADYLKSRIAHTDE